jgi:hypothetical protein
MKFLFLLLDVMSNREALLSAAQCAFRSGVSSLAVLLAVGAYQAIRYSAHRRTGTSL